jgi:hypothetical protein
MPLEPPLTPPEESLPEPAQEHADRAPGTALVPLRRPPAPTSRWRSSLTAVRAGLPQLARHPAVRAAAPLAGVGAGLLLGHLAGRRAPQQLVLQGHVRVDVVHHVVLASRALERRAGS